MKKELLIHTAQEEPEVAIATRGGTILSRRKIERRMLSEKLLAAIDEMMNGDPMSDLVRIVIVSGPGPFTNLRIGAAVTNALGYAHKLPIAPIKGEVKMEDMHEKSKKVTEVKAVLPNYGREPSMGGKR